MPIEFYLLLLVFVTFFCGWFTKIGIEQYIADQEREEEAEKRRQAYEQSRCEEEQIKQQNRDNLIRTWVEEAKGGAKK